MEALKNMGKKPKIIYTNDEASIGGNSFTQYVEGERKKQNIEPGDILRVRNVL
jgi:hypothetical protein